MQTPSPKNNCSQCSTLKMEKINLRVTYTKFKEGEGTVKKVKTEQNYGKSSRIMVELIYFGHNISVNTLHYTLLEYVSEIFQFRNIKGRFEETF